MPQGGSAGPNMIDLANGQPAPSEDATDGVRQPLRVVDGAGRDAAFLVKTTYCRSTPAAIASRGARQAETAPTNGRPKAARVASPRRRRALVRGTRYWQLARPATAARRACRSGRHPSQDASVGEGCVRVLESLARGEPEPWLTFNRLKMQKCCPQSILAVAPRDRPKRLPERHFW